MEQKAYLTERNNRSSCPFKQIQYGKDGFFLASVLAIDFFVLTTSNAEIDVY